MPTLNPRVNVTLSPSLDSLVSRLAALERVSKSMVLRELLETAEPSLVHAVALMEAAQGASANARKALAKDLDKTIKAAEGLSELVIQNLSHNTQDLVTTAQEVRGRRPARRVPASHNQPKRPPSSNRGVKS